MYEKRVASLTGHPLTVSQHQFCFLRNYRFYQGGKYKIDNIIRKSYLERHSLEKKTSCNLFVTAAKQIL